MAKRSDFAQKLLDDLRLRKERMAASHTAKGSKPMSGDAYALAKKSYRGSKEMLTNQTKGFRSGNAHGGSNRDNKSLFMKETSKDIIPFGNGRSSEQMGDLSMALTFALENGGKLVRKESSGGGSMLAFLNQFSRRSVQGGKMVRSIDRHHSSTGQFPTLSHLHVNEIAKGAEKLNQILRACSNGLNFDTYSVQIGKELLKGAMDLEESLRMLVNLQEASDYMTTPKSKTRITLLDDDDEDEDENSVVPFEHNQLDRPRFSFDKPNRNSHYSQEVSRAELNQRLMALAYLSEATNLHHNRHDTRASNAGSHHRSTSYGSNVKSLAAFSEQRSTPSSTKSNSEKGRIPNVIAKLMGLEEPPETKESKSVTQKGSSSIKKVKGIVTENFTEGSSNKGRRTRDVEKFVPSERKQKQMQPHQVQVIQEGTSSLQAEKNPETRHASSFEVAIHNGESPGKDIEGRKLMKGSNKASIKTDRHQANTVKLTQSTRSRHDILDKERKQNTTIREQKGKEKGYTQELENETEATATWPWQTERNAGMPKAEKGDPNRLPSVSQAKSHNELAFHQPYMLHNLEARDIPCGADFLQQSEKLKIKARKQKGNEVAARSSSKPKQGALNLQKRHSHASNSASTNRSHVEPSHEIQSKEFQNNRHREDSVKERSSATQDSLNKNSSQNSSYIEQISDVKGRTGIPRGKDEEPVLLQNNQKSSTTKQKVATPRKIDELVTKRSGASDSFAKSPKHRARVLKEVKKKTQDRPNGSEDTEQVRTIRSKESEVRIIKSNKPIASIQPPNVIEVKAKVDEAPKLPSPPEDGQCQSLEGMQNPAPNDSLRRQTTISTLTNDQESQQIDFGGDESRSQIMSDALDGTLRDSKDMACPSQEASKVKPPEPLTESENHLGQILIKSQLFVNTSEALFRLNIPYDILNSDGHYCQDEERKLIMDCSYEIMRRKGKRQEMSTHPYMRISITPVKISSLDDLIRQLNNDLETLKLYGRNGDSECLVEDYLPRMLENDVYNRYSDVNCMWDCGWDALMGTLPEKDDVARDVERFVLNGLLDEVTRELALAF